VKSVFSKSQYCNILEMKGYSDIVAVQ